MLKLAHAIYDENGKAVGGKPGDQTGKEVTIWNWYVSGKGWEHCFRCKDPQRARRIAEIAAATAQNENIGYSQSDRLGLYYASRNRYVSQIKTRCNTDCSAMVANCLIKAGIKVNPSMYTGNQQQTIMGTKKFVDYTDKKYLMGTNYLKAGDILLRSGHTAVVVDIYTTLDLQKCLNSFGYRLAEDNQYGPKTKAAALDLKKRYGEFTTILKKI